MGQALPVKGGDAYMTVFQGLMLAISFASLIVAVIAAAHKK
ncbi:MULTISPECIES: putative holin-like toxin [unclassified Bacillus (in: firmicutes)]|nr:MULTISPECIES: putative holin-like toxin [unclassified Bacillus (in: firmicutes)]